MIHDETDRYVLSVLPGFRLWRYDRRWRGVTVVEPESDVCFVSQGRHHVCVVRARTAGQFELTVRAAANPAEVLATGMFDGTWHLDGDRAQWANVPEYVLVPTGTATGLLRIADESVIDDLADFAAPLDVVHVIDSRLVVVVSSGAFTVYDPVAQRSVRHYELTGKNPAPTARFRSTDEMWVNDVDTMIKVDARNFEVLDAAGSDLSDAETASESQGGIGRWEFAAQGELCIVTRPEVGDALVLDTVSMLPVARAEFGSRRPLDATLLGRNTIVAVDESGRPLRTRLRRVKIRFEAGDEAPEST